MAGTNYYANVEGKNVATSLPADKGQSFTENLQSAFSNSPINRGEISAEERKETFQKLVLDGEVLNGNGLTSFNRDYFKNGTPDVSNIDTDALNLPSPYIPNPTSPGPGSLDADDKPAFEGTVKDPQTVNSQFGSGNTSTYNPAVSSKKLSDLKLGSYLPGNSGGN